MRDGDELPLGEASASANSIPKPDRKVAQWTAPAGWVMTKFSNPVLRIVRGADWSRFKPEAQISLLSGSFSVAGDSDRMGVRLEGPALMRSDSADLLSEAVVPGTLQVPPNGNPILLLGDCQTIGGYPKMAHVITVDLPLAAQLWPGDHVRFREVSLDEAQKLFLDRENAQTRFRVGLELKVP